MRLRASSASGMGVHPLANLAGLGPVRIPLEVRAVRGKRLPVATQTAEGKANVVLQRRTMTESKGLLPARQSIALAPHIPPARHRKGASTPLAARECDIPCRGSAVWG